MMKKVSFAIFADLHLDITPTALDYFRQFEKELSERKVDFVVELGDIHVFRPWIEEYFRDPEGFITKDEYKSDFEYHKEYYLRYLEVKKMLPGLVAVLGNHDHDRADKEYLKRMLSVPSPYYSFKSEGFVFIILDTNNYYINGEFIPYDNQNYMRDKREGKLLDALGKVQLAWLERELSAAEGPVVIFSHAALDTDVCEREEFAAILRGARNAGTHIVMCANGHNHIDALCEVDGIKYWEVNSMTYRFTGRRYPPVDRYGEELAGRYKNIRYGAPYTKPLFAFVTISEDGHVKIEGRSAAYIPPYPEEIGFTERSAKTGGPHIDDREFYAF